MKEILPEWLFNEISNIYLLDYISEIRIRIGKPIVICYKGRYEVLERRNGYIKNKIIASGDLIEYILAVATKQSYYAYSSQIKHGFITTDSGIRIGLCGAAVVDSENVTTIKNIFSLNIRIAHKVIGCCEKILHLILSESGKIKNTLIISAPGAGKTTFVRDLARAVSNQKFINNILVVDERYEIAGTAMFDLIGGEFVDIISGAPKHFALKEGTKAMNPTVIIADEISEENDFEEVMETAHSGVNIIATAHAGDINDLKNKKRFEKILKEKIFERIVVLSKKYGAGTIEAVYDENLRNIYLPINV